MKRFVILHPLDFEICRARNIWCTYYKPSNSKSKSDEPSPPSKHSSLSFLQMAYDIENKPKKQKVVEVDRDEFEWLVFLISSQFPLL